MLPLHPIFFAQLAEIAQGAADLASPIAQLSAVGFLWYVVRYYLTSIAPSLKSMEGALNLNTRATILLGVGLDGVGSFAKDQMKAILKELEEREQSAKALARRDAEAK